MGEYRPVHRQHGMGKHRDPFTHNQIFYLPLLPGRLVPAEAAVGKSFISLFVTFLSVK